MNVKPIQGVLVIRKHEKTKSSVDIVTEESDEDKRLITGEVIEGGKLQPKGITVIFGKYSLYELVLQGTKYFFLNAEDVIGTCDYKEKK